MDTFFLWGVFQIKLNSLFNLSALSLILVVGIPGCQVQPTTDPSKTGYEEESKDTMQNDTDKKENEHLTVDDSIGDLLAHPAFQGFQNHLMPRKGYC